MRHSQILSRERALFLVIDFQQKLLAAIKESESLLQNCVKLIRFAKIFGLPIIWTEQYPKGLGYTDDSVKSELDHLKPVEKLSFSCFGEPGFVQLLSGYPTTQLIICGIETHICVEQTALDAIEAGYQTHVVSDACGSRKGSDHDLGLHKMAQAGAILTSAEMAMYEIITRSDAKEFREVLKIVK